MRLLRFLALAFVLSGAVALVGFSGAFGAAEVDRSLSVSVAGDDTALVGLDVVETVQPGQGQPLVVVTNNAETTQTVTLTLTERTDDGVQLVDTTETLAPGESATFRVDVDPAREPSRVEFQLQTQGTPEVSLTRAAAVAQPSGVCRGDRLVIDSDRNGNLRTDKVVEIRPGVELNGGIQGAKCVIAGEDVEISGNIQRIAGRVAFGAGSELSGGIQRVGGEVSLGPETELSGNVQRVDGDVTLGADVELSGGIQNVGGSVTVGDESSVGGNVQRVDGDVTLGADTELSGNVQDVGGDVTVGDESSVGGNVQNVDGGVVVGPGTELSGGIQRVGGTVDLGAESSVGGNVQNVGGDVIRK
jgi:hypothetical protein